MTSPTKRLCRDGKTRTEDYLTQLTNDNICVNDYLRYCSENTSFVNISKQTADHFTAVYHAYDDDIDRQKLCKQ